MKPDDIITITADTIDTSTFTIDYDAIKGSYNGISITDFPANTKQSEDLIVAGKSMKKFMDSVEERLALLEPNKELEEEFEQLKKLGNKYRKLEAKLKDRMQTWDLLKKNDQ